MGTKQIYEIFSWISMYRIMSMVYSFIAYLGPVQRPVALVVKTLDYFTSRITSSCKGDPKSMPASRITSLNRI